VEKEIYESAEEEAPESLKEYLRDARYHLPTGLVVRLVDLVDNLLKVRTRDEIKHDRWRAVREALETDAWNSLLYKNGSPYAVASFHLKDTAASASAQMVELDYLAFEQSLPAAERCPIRRKRGPRLIRRVKAQAQIK
jgi:hypothetical protein